MKKHNVNFNKDRKKFGCTIASMLAAFFAVSAFFFANAIDYVSSDWEFSVSYLGSPGEYYCLFAIEGDHVLSDMPEATDENLVYINQETADQNGFVDFLGFSPMRESVATLYIGGSDLEAPVCLGRISDSVFEAVYNNNEIVFVYDGARGLVKYNGDGSKVRIPEGTRSIYDIGIFENKSVTELVFPMTATELYPMISGIKYYYHPLSAVDLSGQSFGESLFLIGDPNNDGKTDAFDLLLFLKNMAHTDKYPIDEIQGDINGDDKFGLADASEFFDIIRG